MALVVIAEPEAEFERWMELQRNSAKEPLTAELQHGKQVFLDGPCVLCHRIRGTLAQGLAGPDLTHFGSRKGIAANTVPNAAGYLAGWITDSQHLKPGTRMPPVSIGPQDLQPLLDYLESLQ
jgi:cytochrome c oxidase subunit 2